MRRVVANAAPLIAFAKQDRLDILRRPYGEVLIPEAVLLEVKSEPARSRVRNAPWIRVVPVADVYGRRMFSARLHAGEVDVMVAAQELGADLVLTDDNAAKKTAKFLGLNVTGTFGVLLRAKREGIIDSVGSSWMPSSPMACTRVASCGSSCLSRREWHRSQHRLSFALFGGYCRSASLPKEGISEGIFASPRQGNSVSGGRFWWHTFRASPWNRPLDTRTQGNMRHQKRPSDTWKRLPDTCCPA